MNKHLSETLCKAFAAAALIFQAPFWLEVFVDGQISDGVLKCFIFAVCFVVITLTILIVHNVVRFAFYLTAREQKRRERYYA